MVIRRLISRGESFSTTPACQQVPVTPALPPALPPLPSFLFIHAHSRALLVSYPPPLSFLHPSIAFLSPFISAIHSIDRHQQPSPALNGIRNSRRTDLTSQLTNTLNHSASQPQLDSSPNSESPFEEEEDPGGLKSNSLPRHSPKVATTLTKYLGEAQTNETWMTKHHQDCSLPLPSMTLSHRLHIRSAVH